MAQIKAVIDDNLPEIVKLQLVGDDDTVVAKNVTLKDYVDIINTNTFQKSYSRLGRLPVGYYDCSYSGVGNFKIVLRIPGRLQHIIYSPAQKEYSYDIPFPDTTFCFDVQSDKVTDGVCFALKGDTLCNMPFPNVYESGSICWGGNAIRSIEVKDLCDIEHVVSLFIQAPFNTHLYSPGIKNAESLSFEDLLRKIKKLDHFPEELLVPYAGAVTTIQDLLDKGVC